MATLYHNDYRYSIFRAVIGLVLGLFLIINPGTTIYTLVWVLAAILVISGGFSIFQSLQKSQAKSFSSFYSLNGLISLALGILVLIFPKFFAGIFINVLGVILLLGAIGQIVSLIQLKARISLSFYAFLTPMLILLLGLFLLFKPFETAKSVFTVFGVLFIVYALSEVWQALRLHKANRAA